MLQPQCFSDVTAFKTIPGTTLLYSCPECFVVFSEAAPALHCREPQGPAVPGLGTLPGTSQCHGGEHGSQHPPHLLLHQLVTPGVVCPGVQEPALPGECPGAAGFGSCSTAPRGQGLLISVPKVQVGHNEAELILVHGLSPNTSKLEVCTWPGKPRVIQPSAPGH